MVLNRTGYRSKLLKEVNSLSTERLRALADFAAYLGEREEWEATAEILGNATMARQIRRSRAGWKAGKKESFVTLSDLKAKLRV